MRIGIANDTALAREALRRVVLSSPEHEVVWTADDGAEAIAMARANPPDLILMDLLMPGVDGVEATRRIMGESPCAILVVTATVSGHLSQVYQAMGYGALDAIDTPRLGPRGEISGAAVLLHKIELIGRLVGKPDRPASGSRAARGRRRRPRLAAPVEPSLDPLVVMGASTGGPQALAEILGRLPAAARGRDHHRAARGRGVRARAGPLARRAGAAAGHADRGGAPAGRRRGPAHRHRRPPRPGRGPPAALFARAEVGLLPALGRRVLRQRGAELAEAGRRGAA